MLCATQPLAHFIEYAQHDGDGCRVQVRGFKQVVQHARHPGFGRNSSRLSAVLRGSMTGFSGGYLHEATLYRRGIGSIKAAGTYEPRLYNHPPVARIIKLQQVGTGGLQVLEKNRRLRSSALNFDHASHSCKAACLACSHNLGCAILLISVKSNQRDYSRASRTIA
jgi:hypothetical protein